MKRGRQTNRVPSALGGLVAFGVPSHTYPATPASEITDRAWNQVGRSLTIALGRAREEVEGKVVVGGPGAPTTKSEG